MTREMEILKRRSAVRIGVLEIQPICQNYAGLTTSIVTTHNNGHNSDRISIVFQALQNFTTVYYICTSIKRTNANVHQLSIYLLCRRALISVKC